MRLNRRVEVGNSGECVWDEHIVKVGSKFSVEVSIGSLLVIVDGLRLLNCFEEIVESVDEVFRIGFVEESHHLSKSFDWAVVTDLLDLGKEC